MSDDFLFKRNSLSQKPITAGLVRRPSETPHCANEMPGKTARTGRLAQKKRMFSGSFRAFSIEVVGQYGSHGDKIYLPQKVFQEVTILYRLEFPLFFKLSNRFGHGEVEEKGEEGWENADSQPPTVYCGIREFSAPKDVCYLPAHVMRTLNIEEGGNVTVESVQVAAMAQWVQFEAKDQGLIEMLGQLGGPKYFLENKLLEYSVLFKGQTLVIQHDGVEYTLSVAECKPAEVNSIVGSIDLEVEFKSITTERVKVGMDDEEYDANSVGGDLEAKALDLSMSLSLDGKDVNAALDGSMDMGWALNNSRDEKHPTTGGSGSNPNSVLSRLANSRNPTSSSLSIASPRIRGGGVTRSPRHPPGHDDPDKQQCPNCDVYVSKSKFEMHELRCRRVVFRCDVCRKPVPTVDREAHAQTHASVECALGCGALLPQEEMHVHQQRDCEYILEKCKWCSRKHARREMKTHERDCGVEMVGCDVCLVSSVTREALVSGEHAANDCAPRCKLDCGERVKLMDQLLHEAAHCINRLAECEYCQQHLKHRELFKHKEYCGSRTESCELCARWIMRKDMQQHLASQCVYPEAPERPPPSEHPFPVHLVPERATQANRELAFTRDGDHGRAREVFGQAVSSGGMTDEELAQKLQAETYYADFLTERAVTEGKKIGNQQSMKSSTMNARKGLGPRARAKAYAADRERLSSSSSSSSFGRKSKSSVSARVPPARAELAAVRERKTAISMQRSALDGQLSSSLRQSRLVGGGGRRKPQFGSMRMASSSSSSSSSRPRSMGKTTKQPSSRIGRRNNGSANMRASGGAAGAETRERITKSSSSSSSSSSSQRRAVADRRNLLDAMYNSMGGASVEGESDRKSQVFGEVALGDGGSARGDALDMMLMGRPLSRSKATPKPVVSRANSTASSSSASSRLTATQRTRARMRRASGSGKPSSSSSSSRPGRWS